MTGAISGFGTGIKEARQNKRSPWTEEKTQLHHSDPKFMGGDDNQTLTKMSTSRHQELHREMNEYLRQQTDLDGNHMRPQRGNSGEKIRGIFSRPQRINALKGFYDSHPLKYWDARYKFYHNNHIRYFPW